jgi:hypothetical protein
MIKKDSGWCEKKEEHSWPNTVKFHAGDPPGVESDYVRDGNLPPRLHVVQALAEKKIGDLHLHFLAHAFWAFLFLGQS